MSSNYYFIRRFVQRNICHFWEITPFHLYHRLPVFKTHFFFLFKHCYGLKFYTFKCSVFTLLSHKFSAHNLSPEAHTIISYAPSLRGVEQTLHTDIHMALVSKAHFTISLSLMGLKGKKAYTHLLRMLTVKHIIHWKSCFRRIYSQLIYWEIPS